MTENSTSRSLLKTFVITLGEAHMLNNLNLVNDPFVGTVAQSIVDLYKEYGRPDGSHTARWQLNIDMFARLTSADVGDWQGREEQAAERFNAAVISLFEMLDYVECGPGVWTCGYELRPEYCDFRYAAVECINDWLAYEAFNAFCDDPYEILK